MSVTNAIQKALAKIGGANGTKIPDYNVPKGINDKDAYIKEVSLLHELAVANCIRSYGKKRHEAAIAKVISHGLTSKGDVVVAGSPLVQIAQRGPFALTLKVNVPGERLDEALLRARLSKELGPKKAMDIIKDCTTSNKPARLYNVLEVASV